MKCPKCNHNFKEVEVRIQDADSLVTSYQCANCGYFEFEENSMSKAIKEIKAKETPLKIRQRIIKLSHDRLGMYFSKDIIRSLDLKGGEEIDIRVPDRKHIVVELENKEAKKS
ncbi:zf-TFIIB domain-containing protein [Candidatus Woesearchaeota archaeon]|nr:zf-TFIIB domain-containing protein [Candidatus Woesearchaeota archaeon]